MPIERKRNLVVKLADDELAMAHALAEEAREPFAMLVRRWIRQHHEASFGDAPAAKTKAKR